MLVEPFRLDGFDFAVSLLLRIEGWNLYVVVITDSGDGLSAFLVIIKKLTGGFWRIAHGDCFVWRRLEVDRMDCSDAYTNTT